MFWRSVKCHFRAHQSPALRICISASAGVNIPPCFQLAHWKSGDGVYNPEPWGQVTRLEIPDQEQSGVNSPVPTWAASLFLSWLSWDPTVSWLLGWGFTLADGHSRRTWEKPWISDAPLRDSATLSRPSELLGTVCLCGRNGVRDPL